MGSSSMARAGRTGPPEKRGPGTLPPLVGPPAPDRLRPRLERGGLGRPPRPPEERGAALEALRDRRSSGPHTFSRMVSARRRSTSACATSPRLRRTRPRLRRLYRARMSFVSCTSQSASSRAKYTPAGAGLPESLRPSQEARW